MEGDGPDRGLVLQGLAHQGEMGRHHPKAGQDDDESRNTPDDGLVNLAKGEHREQRHHDDDGARDDVVGDLDPCGNVQLRAEEGRSGGPGSNNWSHEQTGPRDGGP